VNAPSRHSIFSGPKARHVTAWAEASPASAGPGNGSRRISQGLKGRNQIRAAHVPPLQGGEICWGRFTWGFTPGCHTMGFQPCEQRRIMAGLNMLPAAVDALKRRQAESRRGLHPTLDALLPALPDRAFKGEL